jgi:hypothetical protein
MGGWVVPAYSFRLSRARPPGLRAKRGDQAAGLLDRHAKRKSPI